MTTDKVKAALLKKSPPAIQPIRNKDLLGTGSTLLNLACTGKIGGGFIKGKYFFVVGDSASGKTFISLTCLAEASINPEFDNYRFVYDDVEGGALMDIAKFFGSGVAERIEPPKRGRGGEPIYSGTIEDFYFNFSDVLGYDFEKRTVKAGSRPCIYILDSMDALSSAYERKKFQERKTVAKKRAAGDNEAKAAGDFGDGKAKANSSGVRQMIAALRDTGSILIIVNQTRDNVGGGIFEPKSTRSGGRSLTFYATHELWLSCGKALKRKVNGKDRQVGVLSRVHVKKNRATGRDRTVEVPIYHSFGIDDLGSCVDYLTTEKWWDIEDGVITASEFDFEGKRGALIKKIEDEGLEQDLRVIVAECWAGIEAALVLPRKPRYE